MSTIENVAEVAAELNDWAKAHREAGTELGPDFYATMERFGMAEASSLDDLLALISLSLKLLCDMDDKAGAQLDEFRQHLGFVGRALVRAVIIAEVHTGRSAREFVGDDGFG